MRTEAERCPSCGWWMADQAGCENHLCNHGLALDMHCCECGRAGFLFDWNACYCQATENADDEIDEPKWGMFR